MVQIEVLETPSLGDRSYVVVADGVAAVIDPQRDLDRVHDALARHDARVTHVFETHVHNDYVTGGFQLAQATGAAYHLNADEDLAFDHVPTRDGQEFDLGPFAIRALHTPGHTPHHLSYALVEGERVTAVFTGGSLLFGAVGRTDLIDTARTEELTRAQHRSAHRLVDELPGDARVYPTHGFGSFCSASRSTGGDGSTLAQEAQANPALTQDEDVFVRELVASLTAYPRYYAHMAPLNRQGPPPVDLTPPAPADPAELGRRIHRGEWVVDLRKRRAFAHEHLSGTVSVELGNSFTTYLGWILPWGTPLTFVGDTADDVARAQRDLARIGVDRIEAHATGQPSEWAERSSDLGQYPVVDFTEVARNLPEDALVVDSRRAEEWAEGHVAGSLNVPLHEIEARLPDLPRDRPLWVHCKSGFRASVAASLIRRSGREVVLIDDNVRHARDAGLTWEAADPQGD